MKIYGCKKSLQPFCCQKKNKQTFCAKECTFYCKFLMDDYQINDVNTGQVGSLFSGVLTQVIFVYFLYLPRVMLSCQEHIGLECLLNKSNVEHKKVKVMEARKWLQNKVFEKRIFNCLILITKISMVIFIFHSLNWLITK